MDDRAQRLNNELVKIQKDIDQAADTSRTIVRRMAETLERNYDEQIVLKNKTDYEIIATFFGNDVLIKAEVPLFEATFTGLISCYLKQDNKDIPWAKLNAALTFDKLCNVNEQYDAYEVTHILMKLILDELKKKSVAVKFPNENDIRIVS